FWSRGENSFSKSESPLRGGAHRHAHLPFNQAPLRCAAPCQSDPEGLCYRQHTHALCKLPSHLACGRVVYLLPTEFHTLGDGALEACFDPLPDHRPLELSKRAGYLEDELPHRGRRIDGLLVQIQIHPAGFQVLDRIEQVAQRATQAVNRPSHDDIESPTAGVLEHGIEARPPVSPLGT